MAANRGKATDQYNLKNIYYYVTETLLIAGYYVITIAVATICV